MEVGKSALFAILACLAIGGFAQLFASAHSASVPDGNKLACETLARGAAMHVRAMMVQNPQMASALVAKGNSSTSFPVPMTMANNTTSATASTSTSVTNGVMKITVSDGGYQCNTSIPLKSLTLSGSTVYGQ